MSTMRNKCEGHFVNDKLPNSVCNYIYCKTSHVTSSRCLGCKVLRHLQPDFSATEVDGSTQVTSIPHQV